MPEAKLCSCGGNMRDLGKKYLNIADTLIAGNSVFNFRAVEMYVCESCNKLEFYSLDKSAEPESTDDSLYDTYKDLPTAKLERILEKDGYTEECKSVIRRILSER